MLITIIWHSLFHDKNLILSLSGHEEAAKAETLAALSFSTVY